MPKQHAQEPTLLGIRIGKRIAALLDDREMNQSDLARLMGLKRAAVSHWVRGRRIPHNKRLHRLAKILKVTVGELFGETA